MFKLSRLLKVMIISLAVFITTTSSSYAGFSEEELRRELSFLAKKLLDLSAKDSLTVEQPAYMKPFLGICSDLLPRGVKLTCITPGHSASKAGLKTGDLLIAINNIAMTKLSKRDYNNAFYSVTNAMKAGDLLAIKLIRKGSQQVVNVTVGAISHPAYTLTIRKN